jgi:hypothetical protein
MHDGKGGRVGSEGPVEAAKAWRGAALDRARKIRDILSGARKVKYGVKRAAPASYRTRRFAHGSFRGLFVRLTG